MFKRKKIVLASAALLAFLLITYGTMLYNDYNRVFRQYAIPAFAINHDPEYQEYVNLKNWQITPEYDYFIINYGVFEGIGYEIELFGSFRPFSEISWQVGERINDDGTRTVILEGENDAHLDEEGNVINPVPGVLQARLTWFGREIATLNREYTEDYFVPRGFVMRDIFDPDADPEELQQRVPYVERQLPPEGYERYMPASSS